MLRPLLVISGLILLAFSTARAVEPKHSPTPAETLMCERGKLLLSEAFDKPLGPSWKAAKGKWEVAGGALRGDELPADKHVAVVRTNLKLRNAVIQYSFKLDGAKMTTFSINDAKGHNSRVLLTTDGMIARKDDHDHAGPDQAVVLQTVKTPIKAGEWHTLVIEINGSEFLARLDGKQVAYGAHEQIDVAKTNIGLTVGGASASFKDLRIWEAAPKSDWAATKAKLALKTP